MALQEFYAGAEAVLVFGHTRDYTALLRAQEPSWCRSEAVDAHVALVADDKVVAGLAAGRC
jgi:hypothetical protein